MDMTEINAEHVFGLSSAIGGVVGVCLSVYYIKERWHDDDMPSVLIIPCLFSGFVVGALAGYILPAFLPIIILTLIMSKIRGT